MGGAMRNILILFIAAFALVSFGQKFYPGSKNAAVTPANAAVAPSQKQNAQKQNTPLGSRKVSLYKSYNGHYQAQVDVEGISIGFMVDTGASTIALRQSDAAKIGIRPGPKDYTAGVSTANGVARAARVNLKRVELGSIVVENVQALILPDTALGTNLLGMSFLDQVNWSQKGGNLVLEQ
jgi:aspartyl protease family protein